MAPGHVLFGHDAVKQKQLVIGEICKCLGVSLQDGLASLPLLLFSQTPLKRFSNYRTEVQMTLTGDPLRDF